MWSLYYLNRWVQLIVLVANLGFRHKHHLSLRNKITLIRISLKGLLLIRKYILENLLLLKNLSLLLLLLLIEIKITLYWIILHLIRSLWLFFDILLLVRDILILIAHFILLLFIRVIHDLLLVQISTLPKPLLHVTIPFGLG